MGDRRLAQHAGGTAGTAPLSVGRALSRFLAVAFPIMVLDPVSPRMAAAHSVGRDTALDHGTVGMTELDPRIAQFYHKTPEEDRLKQGPFVLEELRTREVVERYARHPPATVLDVGGAAGAYGLWLADAGYTVHLVEAAARLVAEAERRSAGRPRPLASCRVGDARALDFPDGSADIVLLLGPLYHLKPGGQLFAAAISRWASALDGISRDLFQDPRFIAIVERDLREGQHRNPTERLDYFTTAYFHHPDELRAEAVAAGLIVDGVYGLEGPGWLFSDVTERLADPRRRADLLRVARLLETEPAMLGVSAHLLVAARTPA
jgi:Methyltransferase domain